MSGGMFRRSVRVWFAALVAIAAASCSHKDLCYDHSHIVELNVIFDWSEAPDATPRTMVLQLFELDGSHYNRYEFGSTKGGIIRVRAGAYRMLFHNGDMENVVESGSRYEEYVVMTVDRELLAPIGRASEAPRPGDAEKQPVRFAPEPMWAGNSGPVEFARGAKDLSVTLVPRPVTTTYTVEIRNVENLQTAPDLGGALTGLAASYRPCCGVPSGESVTVPLDMKRADDRTLTTTFSVFGHCPAGREEIHTFSIYTANKWYYHFDVTDQIHDPADPGHVRIVIDGLKLPSSTGGMDSSVSDWTDNEIETDIEMN